MSSNGVYHFATSSQGVPIQAHRFANRGCRVLILGGVHGDEVEGVALAYGLLNAFNQSFPFTLDLTLVPAFNIDGVLKHQRKNLRQVDLNRNLPTQDWSPDMTKESYNPGPAPCSEPENQALVKHLQNHCPKMILSLHSWEHPMLNTNGDCQKIASQMSAHTGLPVTDDIGYPTPGSLGTYCGLERQIPTVTYELKKFMSFSETLRIHIPAIMEGLKTLE